MLAATRPLEPTISVGTLSETGDAHGLPPAGLLVGSTYGSATGAVHLKEPLPDRDDLIDRAVTLGNEHAVKFVEACWRAYDTQRDFVFPAAAKRAVAIYETQAR